MNKNQRAIIIVICTLVLSIGQVLMKYAVNSSESILHEIFSIPLLIGLIVYAIASILLIMALKDADLSLIYPFIALSFVWISIFSITLLVIIFVSREEDVI